MVVDITGEAEGDRRGVVYRRPDHAARESHLSARSAAISTWSGSITRSARPTCKRVDCDYYTDAIDYTQVKVLEEFESEALAGRARARTATCA